MSSDFLTAIHIMTYLTYKQGDSALVTSDELADTLKNNPVVIRRLMGRLKKADLVDTVRGKHGGFRLGRSAKDICLLTVFRAIEGDDPDLFAFAHRDKRAGCHPIADSIGQTLNELLRQSLNEMKRELANHSVDEVLDNSLARLNLPRC